MSLAKNTRKSSQTSTNKQFAKFLSCFNRWKEGEVIGHGSFGRVVSGLNLTTGEIMAVKQVHIGSVQAPNVKEVF